MQRAETTHRLLHSAELPLDEAPLLPPLPRDVRGDGPSKHQHTFPYSCTRGVSPVPSINACCVWEPTGFAHFCAIFCHNFATLKTHIFLQMILDFKNFYVPRNRTASPYSVHSVRLAGLRQHVRAGRQLLGGLAGRAPRVSRGLDQGTVMLRPHGD